MSPKIYNDAFPEPPPQIDLNGRIEIENLLARIAAMEDRFENSGLSQEATHRGLRIDELRQRMRIRTAVIVVAVAVLIAMFGVLLFAGYQVTFTTWLTIFSTGNSLFVVAILAPIASITSISALLMIGAFRGFKDSDMDVDKASLLELARASNSN